MMHGQKNIKLHSDMFWIP